MKPAAKRSDTVVGVDTHIVLIPTPGGPVPTPLPNPFNGVLCDALSATVLVDEEPAATEGSIARNVPPHIPAGGPFQTPPKNEARIVTASATVLADGKGMARQSDTAKTCNDPQDAPNGTVVAASTVIIGD